MLGPVRRVTGFARITLPERTIARGPNAGQRFSVTTPDPIAFNSFTVVSASPKLKQTELGIHIKLAYLVPLNDKVFEIACAELCGWGHYRMIGRVYVHPSQEQFLEWLEMADQEAHKRSGPR